MRAGRPAACRQAVIVRARVAVRYRTHGWMQPTQRSVPLAPCLPPPACRAGRPGTVVSLVSGGERHVIDKLQRRLGVQISEVDVRGGEATERDSQPAAGAAAAAGKEQRSPARAPPRRAK